VTIATGRRRHRLTLQTPGEEVPDGSGGWTLTVTTLADVYGEITAASARGLERLIANTTTTTASHLVTIPYVAGVSEESTVIFHDGATDRLFSISGVIDVDEAHVQLVLACEEVRG
jgi:SPP1 family predicted phage head-tail adaptor